MVLATLSDYSANNLLIRLRTRIRNTLNHPCMEKKKLGSHLLPT